MDPERGGAGGGEEGEGEDDDGTEYRSFVRPGVGVIRASPSTKPVSALGPSRVRKGDAVLAWVEEGDAPVAVYATRATSSALGDATTAQNAVPVTKVLCDRGRLSKPSASTKRPTSASASHPAPGFSSLRGQHVAPVDPHAPPAHVQIKRTKRRLRKRRPQ